MRGCYAPVTLLGRGDPIKTTGGSVGAFMCKKIKKAGKSQCLLIKVSKTKSTHSSSGTSEQTGDFRANTRLGALLFPSYLMQDIQGASWIHLDTPRHLLEPFKRFASCGLRMRYPLLSLRSYEHRMSQVGWP